VTDSNKRKILVVDDEINVCKSIRQAILAEIYEVDMALSGEEALGLDKEKKYDMVITDLMMPGISGVDLLTSLKDARPEVIVIMITGYPTIKTAVQSIKIGAFDYIPKPFTPDELRGLVSRAFKEADSIKLPEEVRPPSMPKGLFLMRGHTWLRREKENLVIIGAVYDLLRNIENITEIELMSENKNVFQGEACARITDIMGHIHRIWSPATGMISMVNKDVMQDLALLKNDPYGKGWLLKIEATDLEKDLQDLTST
jgi:DNA-binding response OmpR family regulator